MSVSITSSTTVPTNTERGDIPENKNNKNNKSPSDKPEGAADKFIKFLMVKAEKVFNDNKRDIDFWIPGGNIQTIRDNGDTYRIKIIQTGRRFIGGEYKVTDAKREYCAAVFYEYQVCPCHMHEMDEDEEHVHLSRQFTLFSESSPDLYNVIRDGLLLVRGVKKCDSCVSRVAESMMFDGNCIECNLKKIDFNPKLIMDDNGDIVECCVCKEELTENTSVKLKCGHYLHILCKSKLKVKKCPLCRKKFEE